MKVIRFAAALCCTVLLAACFPPTTDHPIGGAHTSADRGLLGNWNATMDEGDKDDNHAIFHFRSKSSGIIAVMVESTNKKEDDRISATITTAKVGGNRFMNATIVDMGKDKDADKDSEKLRGTIPLLYRTEGSTVVLYMMDESATKAAIKAGKIKGEVEPGSFGDAFVTADQRTLDAYMSSTEGAGLFTMKFATLTKAD